MKLSQMSPAILFLCLLITITVVSSNPTYFTGDVSINCGSTETSATHSGREWLGDVQPRLPSLLQLKGLSMISTVIHNTISDPVPHETARLSRSQFSYLFQVNPGLKIIRLHFNPASYRGFEGLLDLFTVEAGPFTLLSNFSASLTADALGVDTFVKEFYLNIQENQHLIISFSPKSSQTLDTYAFINGIEIVGINRVLTGFEKVKLSNMDGSLASPNPLSPNQDLLFLASLGSRNVTAAIAIAVICLVNIIVHKLREIWEDSSTEEENKPSPKAAQLCCCFSLAEIQLATRNFSEELLIGRGGFGNVYRGLINEGRKTVAIKKLNSDSMQGALEFLTEIETLSQLRHVNLVSLIGYCNEHGEMILVYDYMAGGTLRNHLYTSSRKRHYLSSLTWKQRLNICIGAGRGLDYLHTGHGVIHRDVKSSNILLDEDFIAKVSDFGLAKPENKSMLQTHVSTKVKGTRGYLDPHYFHTSKLTRKSDTYAFGVVLLEVLCGRPAVDLCVTEDEQVLSMWARDKNSSGEVDQIVDLSLRDEISPNSLKTFVEVADRCLEDDPNNRPTMSQVVLQLELALQQHESKDILVSSEISSSYEEPGQSVDTGQSSVFDVEVQNLTQSPKGQTNSKVFSAKVSRFWSWNRSNSSKENELLLSEIREANEELIIFDWRTLSAATNNFSSSNKVGKGGFGIVYKGVLPTGKVVAVKRRSTSPTQSLQEFKNEILLLPNLHHPNIIKLLGYCIHSREKLLVYEFMENKSIDTFIDDEQRQDFPWPVRFNIIKGIARGLIYLHQDSELRVIHGDPKSSNILLDNEMIPKISDFGFSTTLLEHQSELETGTAAGTPFYISPERLKHGRVSVKSDVYSFGVVMLEIVSGQRAWRSYTMKKMKLDDYARKLRSERKVLELVDGSLGGAFPADEVMRCIQVGLRCTLEHPDDRPDMPSVLQMLDGDPLCCFYQADVAGDISINCGATGASAAPNGRHWLGDVRPKLSPLLQLGGLSAASTAIRHLTSADPVPRKTARISQSQFSYVFQLSPGQKIIRLHFNPTAHRGFKGLRDLFTVEAGRFTLLSNFSASLTADALGVNTLVKEYCLNVQENQQFIITFSPETSQSQDRYAFINGIEIISVPPSLSYFSGGDIELRVVGQNSKVYVDDSTALEIVHRLNIKEDLVPPTGDFDGVFPKWATQRADKFKNNTWKMPVEVGFKYLIRLHFSEAGLKIAGAGDSMFQILIDEKIAYTNTDQIVNGGDQDSIILYKDYMVLMRGRKQNGRRRDISISLQSFNELADGLTVLAGFEIVKLSNPDDSLASPNPLPPAPQDSRSHKIRNLLSVLGYQNASATVAVAVISLLSIIIHKLREIWEARSTEDEHKPSANAERHYRRFSLAEIQLATRNFNDGLLIGRGGFGKVYKGFIDDGRKTVAIKRLRFDSTQGAHEFMTEIETLSELRHMNLVSLIGYCSERREMILVYEYMPCGTLADQLYKLGTDCSSLNWKQCLNICIGAARGLDYLHTGLGIIHRDVKATNILLDENFMAKVSDFGLARSEDRSNLQSHVITQIKGTRGYLDPYYIKTGKLTRKSDIYAFGVVLLEVLCGRKALDLGLLEEERLLSCWALDKISKGEVDQIVASVLRDEISQNSLKTFVEVAERCLHDEPKYRPTMSQIVLQLEFALEQEERKEQFSVPKGIDNVANDVYPANEGMTSSENAKQPEEASTEVQTVTSPAVGTSLSYSSDDKEDGKRPRTHSPLRFWERAGAFLNWTKPSKNKEKSSLLSEIRGLHIKLREFDLNSIATATNRFSPSQEICGENRTFTVYKGVLSTGQKVTVKRYSSFSFLSGLYDFKKEIILNSKLNHRNIMNLVGYCIHEGEEVILVSDYASQGNLFNHLHSPERSPLTWKQRLQICIDAAKGLDYLHTGCNHPTIHRDVKSTNILLDEKWVAKLFDFSCWRETDADDVTTMVVGTFGYLDPEYFMTSQLTDKSDVYSFGVVLLEVLCAKRAIMESNTLLATWAPLCFKEGTLDEIIDANLRGQIAPECLTAFSETANACLSMASTDRPAMREVVRTLEFAMQRQLEAEETQLQELSAGDGGNSMVIQ